MTKKNDPHLSTSFGPMSYPNPLKWLKYTGNPKTTYDSYNGEGFNAHDTQHLCAISCIWKIIITSEYLFINSTFFTFKVPHTEQTYSELQNIMEAHHSETV